MIGFERREERKGGREAEAELETERGEAGRAYRVKQEEQGKPENRERQRVGVEKTEMMRGKMTEGMGAGWRPWRAAATIPREARAPKSENVITCKPLCLHASSLQSPACFWAQRCVSRLCLGRQGGQSCSGSKLSQTNHLWGKPHIHAAVEWGWA